MDRPTDRDGPPVLKRAGKVAGRISLGLLALGTTILSFGLAIGIGTRLDNGQTGGGETIVLRGMVRPGEPVPTPATMASPTDIPTPAGTALQGFYTALNELTGGRRNRPVTVLHIGDSHVSGDRLDAHLRVLLQNQFGDAGRSMLPPGGVIKGLRARGLRFQTNAGWTGKSALQSSTAVLGITGIQATASSVQAEMSIVAQDGRFDSVEVAFLAGPDRGAATISIDGHPNSVVTRSPEIGVQRAKFSAPGEAVIVRPSGTGPVTVLSLSLLKDRPGIRYAGLGLPGGGIETIERLDELVLVDDLRALRPDLVILGFGGSEAQDDRLDIARYRERFSGLMRLFKRILPEASFVVVGPPDSNRVPEFAARLRGSPSTACRALDPQEVQEHDALVAASDERLARWYPPPRLGDVRGVLQLVSSQSGAYFWDWARVMGGACGMHAWVHSKPELALPDHQLLTDEGYQRSGRALFTDLLQGYVAGQPAHQAAQR